MSQETKKEEQFDLLDSRQSSALEQMERAQIDVQIATAKKYPRSMELFQRRALAMVSLDEETAASTLYRRPVGKKQVNGKWVEEFAEGESIRMAEIVASSFGNIRVAAKIVEQTERYVKCVGMAHDLESNYASQAETVEPTIKRDGSPYSEGMRAVVAKACLSKAWRDALFRVVPKSLCKSITDEARKIAIGDSTTLEKRRAKVNDWVTKCGIAAERVWAALGIKGPADLTLESLETLTGIKTAIKDGDTTLDAAFPETKFETRKAPTPETKAGTGDDHPPGLEPKKEPTNPPDASDPDEAELEAKAQEEQTRLLAERQKKQDEAAAAATTKAPVAAPKPTKVKVEGWLDGPGKPEENATRHREELRAKLKAANLTEAQLCGFLKSRGVDGCLTIEHVEAMSPNQLALILGKFEVNIPKIAEQPGKSAQ